MTLIHGEALDSLRAMPDCSADSLVTDPPAGIGFMGKAWDGDKGGRAEWVSWLAEIMREALRVLKPGGHALVWCLPRTAHWTACAVEDAGFEIRDTIAHLFGQGFPKSHNLDGGWQGWGTALKPGREDWILARKPISERTVAANVQRWGTGAINIDGCRIGIDPLDPWAIGVVFRNSSEFAPGSEATRGDIASRAHAAGRWPANVVLDEEAGALLDRQSGIGKSTKGKPRESKSPGDGWGMTRTGAEHDDEVGASRFFYVAKPSRSEKEAGCAPVGDGRANNHPTVKPVALMRYLCRMVTPPGGLVLDPFAGSGTTGVAAKLEGFRFAGIERDEGYAKIAEARIAHAADAGPLFGTA